MSRYLIELSIKEANRADVTSYDDAWRFANDVYRSLQNDVSTKSDDDAMWLSVKSWNVGIQLLGISSDGNVAEKWCSFAIQVMSRVSDVTRRSAFETHVSCDDINDDVTIFHIFVDDVSLWRSFIAKG